jgi:hypothetical protein
LAIRQIVAAFGSVSLAMQVRDAWMSVLLDNSLMLRKEPVFQKLKLNAPPTLRSVVNAKLGRNAPAMVNVHLTVN